MIKILKEYVIRNEEQKDIVLDRIYNDPKLRKYSDIIDYYVDYIDDDCSIVNSDIIDYYVDYIDDDCSIVNRGHCSIEEWWTAFKINLGQYRCFLNYLEDEDAIEDVCEVLNTPSDITENQKSWYDLVDKLVNFLRQIRDIIDTDETLFTDLFYSASSTEADINDNDWNFATTLAQRIANYTNSYDVEFHPVEIEEIKRHMKKTNIPLYRIESLDMYSPYMKYKMGKCKTIHWDKDVKSFTEDPNCNSMIGMKYSRKKYNGKIIIYATQGPVYSFNIDQLSVYAEGVSNLEYEHLVSGEFEVIDTKETHEDRGNIDITWVYMKQLHK